MYWPGPNDYASALINSRTCFADSELANGVVDYHKAGGIPQTITGNFACIYRVKGLNKNFAIKCFLRNIIDQAHRYTELENHLTRFCIENTIAFKYLTQGISIDGTWYPIVKMDWVEGDSLDWYIQKNSNHFGTLADLVRQFRSMVQRLRSAKIAHGDLHHGNIHVTPKGLRLLDYDGAFVPSLTGLSSNELGHPNYQHPGRNQSHFDLELDNFSAWVIHTSLVCLSIDGTLWHRLAGGDECLLFRSSDFGNPAASYTFSLLEGHSSAEVRQAARTLRELCNRPPEEIPPLGESITQSVLPPLRASSLMPGWLPQAETQSMPSDTADAFPGFREYNEAMKSPDLNFEDLEVRHGVCILEDTRAGTNGRVYHFRCESRDVAVKCFLSDQLDRGERYSRLEESLEGPIKQYFVDFEYLRNGIKINNRWYPILKMEWSNGIRITEIPKHKVSEGLATYLADQFMTMALTLRRAGIAHGDLEFSNILVDGIDLKIVDYDAMFVPNLARFGCSEVGHPGFQHPRRTKSDYAPYIDNFSAWLLHFMIKNMPLNPHLCDLAAACLQEERRGTNEHVTLRGLETHPEGLVRQLGLLLRNLLSRPLHMIPDLDRDESLQSILARTTKEVTRPATGRLIHRKPKPKP
jgi:tRNA A-37 threonylcarbamoyl transferase component Bud32